MKKLMLIVLSLSMVAAFSGCIREEDETEFGIMKQPISDIGYVDVSELEFNTVRIEDINATNAEEIILGYYGLELNVPETWTITSASGKMLNDLDSKAKLVFENFTEEEANSYMEEFYEIHHLGDKKFKKFKTDDGYKWDVQIKGVSIKDTYTFKKEGNKLSLLIEKYF